MVALDSVRVTVAEVREQIFAAAANSRGMHSTTASARAGQLFHMTAAALLDADHPAFWRRTGPEDLAPARLASMLYEHALGPLLMRDSSRLQQASNDVIAAWNATRSFAEWFADLLDQVRDSGALTYQGHTETWVGLEDAFLPEVELSARVIPPALRRPVLLCGRADLVLRLPNQNACVVEFKTSTGSEEADLAQACLYRLLLDARYGGATSIALVRFLADGRCDERVFSPEQTAHAEARLLDLIGSLALQSSGNADTPAAEPSRPVRKEDSEAGRQLLAILEEFGAPATLAAAPVTGPAFVRFTVNPRRGIDVKRIARQGANLQVRMNLARAPIIQTNAGHLTIDVQRADREFVPFSSIRELLPALDRAAGNARMLAGIDLFGHPWFADLAAPESTHALVAGTSGSGKTLWLTTALASLILTNTPATLRLVLIDPKRNAFPEMKHSPFLWTPDSLLYPPEHDAIHAFEELIEEMERRYRLFESARAQHLAEYVARTGNGLPRIVCLCDEYADLVMANRKMRDEIERGISRLGQKARAAGIHLIIATQRPSRDVVSGTLKSNLPCRIALRVTDSIESRIILDRTGAELLLGSGDLLFLTVGDPVRLQSPFLSQEERESLFERPAAAR